MKSRLLFERIVRQIYRLAPEIYQRQAARQRCHRVFHLLTWREAEEIRRAPGAGGCFPGHNAAKWKKEPEEQRHLVRLFLARLVRSLLLLVVPDEFESGHEAAAVAPRTQRVEVRLKRFVDGTRDQRVRQLGMDRRQRRYRHATALGHCRYEALQLVRIQKRERLMQKVGRMRVERVERLVQGSAKLLRLLRQLRDDQLLRSGFQRHIVRVAVEADRTHLGQAPLKGSAALR